MPPLRGGKDALRDLLAEGKRGEIGNAAKIARDVIDVPGILAPLIECLGDRDPTVVAHAAHAAMQIAVERPGLFRMQVEGLMDRIDPPSQWELGEQLPKILVEQELTSAQAERLAGILEARLQDRSAIAAASALSALARLGERGMTGAERVRSAHQTALASSSKALAARARRIRPLVRSLG